MLTLMYVLNAMKDCWTYDDTDEVLHQKNSRQKKLWVSDRPKV